MKYVHGEKVKICVHKTLRQNALPGWKRKLCPKKCADKFKLKKNKKKIKKNKWSPFLRDRSLSETRRVPLWSFFWLKMGPLNVFFETQKRLSCVNKARKQIFGVKIGVLYLKPVLELIVMLWSVIMTIKKWSNYHSELNLCQYLT